MLHIFILHYAKDDVTHACLDALLDDPALTGETTRLFVIDNGSPRPFKKGERTEFEVIRWKRNLFLIDAFNEAIQEYPAARYLCITNDTKPRIGMVGKLMAALDDPAVGIVAPGTNDSGAGILCVSGPGEWPSHDVRHIDNTCWAWRHDLVEAIGLPDCAGHTHRACWASNQDYCYRARQAGYKVLAVRSAYIWHAHMGGQDKEAWQAGHDWLLHKWGDKIAEVE